MEFPKKCPYCGKDITKNCVTDIKHPAIGCYVTIELHICRHCNKPITYINYLGLSNTNSDEFAYPPTEPVAIPKRIKLLSLEAYKAFTQSIFAKNSCYDMLVGAGIRIATEHLIYKYLTLIKQFKENDLKDKTLGGLIPYISGDLYKKICAKLLLLYGNSNSHKDNRHEVKVEDAISAFEQLCSLIDGEMQMLDAAGQLPKTAKLVSQYKNATLNEN